ncbi:MAG: DMT family transporter [Burkholderiales bacterium]|nr:DMT family transporter [Burkholderiales bacterium]
MKPRDLAELLLLAAIWGASFLFMRLAVPAFGPIALADVRVTGAALLLLPLALAGGHARAMRGHAGPLLVAGVFSSALPFIAFSQAALHLGAGLMSVLNATTPLFAALIAWRFLGERLDGWRIAGLLIGLAGVALLVADRLRLDGSAPALAACLGATACYAGVSAYAQQRLADVPPLGIAAGTQLGAAAALLAPAAVAWPAQLPGALPWAAALGLAALCSALAYVLYFRLLQRVGSSRATAVTFLIPAFGILWGAVFLGERLTPTMLAAGAVIVVGTMLATGYWRPAGGPPPQTTA